MLELAADEVYRLRYEAGQAWAQQAVDAAKADRRSGAERRRARHARSRARLGRRADPRRAGARRGDRDRRHADRRAARRPPRRRRRTRRRGDLPRPLRRGRRARRARARGRPGNRTGSAVPRASTRRSASPGAWSVVSPTPPSCSTRPSRQRACPATRRRWRGRCSAERSSRSRPVTSRPPSPPAQESLELATEANQDVIAARAASILAVALLDAGQSDRAAAVLAELARRRAVRLHPRRLAGLSARADDPLLAGARPPRGSTGRRCRRAGQCRGGRPALGDRDGLPRDRSRRPGRRRRRHRPRSRRCKRPISPTPSACRSRPAWPAPSPAGRWLQLGDKDRAVRAARTGSRRARPLRRRALPRRGAARTAPARPAHPPAHPAGRLRPVA